MAFRPEWYQKDDRRRGSWGGGVRNWSALRIIMTASFGVWFVQLFLYHSGAESAYRLFIDVFALRAWTGTDPNDLGFNFLFPIQLFSYMVLHSVGDPWHVIWNMLYLWFFSRQLEAVLGKGGLLRLYVAGGVVGGLAQWLFMLVAGSPVPTLGASGAVYAVMLLFALRWPKETIILFPLPIPLPIWVLVGIKVAMDAWAFITGTPGGTAVLAHLGGAFLGYVWFKRGDIVAHAQEHYQREKHAKKLESASTDRREMDRILGKIQTDGLKSLSASERAFLDKRSRELRKQGR